MNHPSVFIHVIIGGPDAGATDIAQDGHDVRV
jgi:hypothetical protein